jgi:hypothetical protein
MSDEQLLTKYAAIVLDPTMFEHIFGRPRPSGELAADMRKAS